jgi:hypothetical protein
MASRPTITLTVELHTPEELLDGAEVRFASAIPKVMRAAALEAITALEAFVQDVVFTALQCYGPVYLDSRRTHYSKGCGL